MNFVGGLKESSATPPPLSDAELIPRVEDQVLKVYLATGAVNNVRFNEHTTVQVRNSFLYWTSENFEWTLKFSEDGREKDLDLKSSVLNLVLCIDFICIKRSTLI